MSDSGKQSPTGANTLAALLDNKGLGINPNVTAHVGSSTSLDSHSPGKLVNSTVLRMLTYAINRSGSVSSSTHTSLINIGKGQIPALGNAPPTTYDWARRPYWNSYTRANAKSPTNWGYVRLFALQAHNELNYNLGYSSGKGLRDFMSYFMASVGFIEYSNSAIIALDNSKKFLKGSYSGMNDLITADISGVCSGLPVKFGDELMKTGRAINLEKIASFGMPSNLLQTIYQNNALTPALSIALLATGLTSSEITALSSDSTEATTAQQNKIQAAFSLVTGNDLKDILTLLNVAIPIATPVGTAGLKDLNDLLKPDKLFPTTPLTVPIPS